MNDSDPRVVGDVLDRAVTNFSPRRAVVHGAQSVSYGQLGARVERIVRGLRGKGIRRGDHVVVWMPNCTEWVVTFYALAKIGAVVVSCNTRYKSDEVKYILRQSRAVALVMAERLPSAMLEFVPLFTAMTPAGTVRSPTGDVRWPDLPDLRGVIVLGDQLPPGASKFADVEREGAADREGDVAFDAPEPDDPVAMVYTSGTTGYPKGCLLSHKALLLRARQRSRFFDWRDDDTFLVTMPYFHIAGAIGPIIASALRGTPQILVDVFDAVDAMRLIAEESVTILSGVPTMFAAMLDHPRRSEFDLRSLRHATLGSTSIPEELIVRLADPERGLGMNVMVMYGLTEACGSTHRSQSNDPPLLRATTVGVAVEGVADRIVDPNTGDDLPNGTAGELCVRGQGMMLGYFAMPDATNEKTRGGWLHTGDVATKDDHGYVRIVGRLDDTINVGGFNTYPAEIERILGQHPAVSQVAVVGLPDLRLGEVVAAYVVPHPDAVVVSDELIAFAQERMAGFKVPRLVELVGDLPMTASGKVQRFRLRQRPIGSAGSSDELQSL